MCSSTSISFKWLDILEKEFDNAFVNIELLLGQFDVEDCEGLHVVRKKLATMCSCFSQLSHKALTIFQLNCKAEAEIVNLKSEIVEMKIQNQLLEVEVHSLLVRLHSDQLKHLDMSNYEQIENIKNTFQRDLATSSPVRASFNEFQRTILNLETWKRRLQVENELLRSTVVSLQAEVCGARLAAHYLDKELAGRMQQLQLLTREDMNAEVKNKLWDQLNAEILLQRHKTVIKVMRQQKNHTSPPKNIAGLVRNVYLRREPSKGLGISVTGGKEHGVPILISELEPVLETKNLYVGDAILSVNGIDLNQFTHKEAVKVLSSQMGNVTLAVITLSTVNISEMEEETNIPSNLSYPFVEDFEIEYPRLKKIPNTPTAPRTPPSCTNSIRSSKESAKSIPKRVPECPRQEESSDNEFYGITTLQNIFRTLSPIESSQEITIGHELKAAAQESTVPTGCSIQDHRDNLNNEEPVHGSNDFIHSIRTKRSSHHVANGKPVAAVLNSNLPSERTAHSSLVSEFGDSSLGTPV